MRALIAADGRTLPGEFDLPSHRRPPGVVLFAHPGGVGHLNPQNRHLAAILRDAGLATLVFDLLTQDEAAARDGELDLRLLALRLLRGTEWVESQPETTGCPVGYIGASTGAAAAVIAASQAGLALRAIVSRGGRPDLAAEFLPNLVTPLLCIVGEKDAVTLKRNRATLACLRGTKELTVIPGASPGFEEPGTLIDVGHCAARWFLRYF